MNMRVTVGQADIGAELEENQDIAVSDSLLRGTADQATDSKLKSSDVAALHFPHAGCGCADTMHELANSMTAMLINAQALGWKLPPYSRLKRPVREIELHARRSGALLSRLLQGFEIYLRQEAGAEFSGQVPSLDGTTAAVRAQGPTSGGAVKLPPQIRPASVLGPNFSPEGELTLICDPCTSTLFPKEER